MPEEAKVYDDTLKDKTEKELVMHLVSEIDTFLATGVGRGDHAGAFASNHLHRLAVASGTTSRELIRREKS